MNLQIHPYKQAYHSQLLSVWERSVLATHDFLDPEDFRSIKEIVHSIDFLALDVYCLLLDDQVEGFIGVADKKVEMLFLSPDYLGLGWGKKLMRFAISELKADKVDVNEQNTPAVTFYKKLGFETYERSEKDDQGNDYPILRMRHSEEYHRILK